MRSPEEKQKLLAGAREAMEKENLSVASACKKMGISVSNYYAWTKKKKGKKLGKRKTRKPILQTALVAVTPEMQQERLSAELNGSGDGGTRPTIAQAAELLGRMNAASLATLLQGRM